tara:strand:- start:36823 stop:37299 length:477 start_codon:yes stop_codon:yes gene_type:complete
MKKPKVTIITGTPGTGKSTLAKKLAKERKAIVVDVNALIKKEKLFDGYDRSLKTSLVDIEKLNKKLLKLIKELQKEKKDIIIDSHLSHYLPPRVVDECIVTKCSKLLTLKRRLEKRKYSKKKVRENMDAEIFDVCALEAYVNKHKKIKIVDSCKRKKK